MMSRLNISKLKTSNKWLWRFMLQHSLVPKKGQRCYLAVSGGIDSMFLLAQFLLLRKNLGIDFQVIHVNHSARVESDQEQLFLEEFCKSHNVIVHSHRVKIDNKSNFEATARKARYQIFNRYLGIIYLAHHIDDSFEWYLMQQFRNATPSLGIPVRNKNFFRPLMCFSKKQIYTLAKKSELAFCEDHSNYNIRYDRNFIRMFIKENISKRFPNYLQHYVHRQNQLAFKLNKHIRTPGTWHRKTDSFGVIYLNVGKAHCLGSIREKIKKDLINLSTMERGNLERQLDRVELALENGKNGPLAISGDISVWLAPGQIYLLPNEMKERLALVDQYLYDKITNQKIFWSHLSFSNFEKLVLEDKNFVFPGFIIFQECSWLNGLRRPLPIFPKTQEAMLSQSLNYQSALSIYRKWQVRQNCKLKVLLSWQLLNSDRKH